MTSTSIAPKAKIYTKTGDQGKTRLVDGTCVEKHNPRVEAYGTVDELNSNLGVCISLCFQKESFHPLGTFLQDLQVELFNLGSILATADEEVVKKLPVVDEASVVKLEKKIDELSAQLPELKNFILPGGHLLSANLHVARTVCRRAERRSAEVINLAIEKSWPLIFLNRLSDFLFVAARWVNIQEKETEILWKPKA